MGILLYNNKKFKIMRKKYLVERPHGIADLKKGDIIEIENIEQNGPIISVNGDTSHPATKDGYLTSSAEQDSGWKLIEEKPIFKRQKYVIKDYNFSIHELKKGDVIEVDANQKNSKIYSVNGKIPKWLESRIEFKWSILNINHHCTLIEERNWDGVEFTGKTFKECYKIQNKKTHYTLFNITNDEQYISVYSQEMIDDNFASGAWVEIKQTKNKEMKATTFVIKGKPSLLTAITEELLEMGYVLIDGQMPRENDICIRTTKDSAEGTTREEFSRVIAMPCSSINTKNKQFSLPAQYEEALAFCKEQLSDAYWTKEEELKIGDFIYFLKQFDSKNIGFIAEIRNISADTHSTKGWIDYNNGGFRWCDGKSNGYTLNKDFRKATEQEIKAHKEKELLEEAVKRGFTEGAKFTSPGGGTGFTVKLPLYVLEGGNIYGQGAGCIYSANTKKWATIVPQETILTLGSNNVRVHITKEKVWADGKEGYFNMSHLKQYIFETQQGKSLGAYSIKLDNENERIFLIGCRDEKNMFSLKELQQVVDEYDKLQ